jgi:hypothetical protein
VGRDKLKLAPGGLKAVTTPIPQLWAQVGRERVEVDLVVAERTVLAKGARDAVLYALAGTAGLEEIDPGWSLEALGREIELGLAMKGLPLDGCCSLFVEEAGESSEGGEGGRCLGRAVVGPLPVVRAPQTEERQSRCRKGVTFDLHARNLAGISPPRNEAAARTVGEIGAFFYRYSPALELP